MDTDKSVKIYNIFIPRAITKDYFEKKVIIFTAVKCVQKGCNCSF